MAKETIDKKACSTRQFSPIKQRMDLIDWQNAKEACIHAINQAKASIEMNQHMLLKANLKINELSRQEKPNVTQTFADIPSPPLKEFLAQRFAQPFCSKTIPSQTDAFGIGNK